MPNAAAARRSCSRRATSSSACAPSKPCKRPAWPKRTTSTSASSGASCAKSSRPRRSTGPFALRCLDELEQARSFYLEEVSYLVPAIVERYHKLGVDRDDLCQEGYMGLLRAIEGYDWRRGVRFATYAKYWIQDSVLKALYDQSRTVRLPVWIQKLWQMLHKAGAATQSGPVQVNDELAEKLDVSKRRLSRVLDSRKSHISIDRPIDGDEGSASLADSLTDESAEAQVFASDLDHVRTVMREVVDEMGEREALVLRRRFGLDGSAPESLKEIGKMLGLSAERVRQIQAAALDRLRTHQRVSRLADA
jgi:RNA polymerase primary sigma factor